MRVWNICESLKLFIPILERNSYMMERNNAYELVDGERFLCGAVLGFWQRCLGPNKIRNTQFKIQVNGNRV